MVKDHKELERKIALPTSWATLSNKQQAIFYMHHSTGSIVHTVALDTPVVEHWLEWEMILLKNPKHL